MADKSEGNTFNRDAGGTGNWARDGFVECSLPTKTPSLQRGDILKPTSMLKDSNLDHPYRFPSGADTQNLLATPRLTQNGGEYKDYGGEDEWSFKDSDREWRQPPGKNPMPKE